MRFDHQKPVETSQSETLDNILYNKNNLHLYAARLDATYKKSKWFQFTFGGEYNSSRNSGHLEATGNMPDSDYKNTENRLAGFVEWAMEAGRFSLSAGLRYEHSRTHYRDFKDASNNLTRTYDRLFPSLSLSWQGNTWSHSLTYATKTMRPGFSQLSNNTYYADQYSYQKGNPLLKPSTSYTLQWSSSYRFLNIYAQYRYCKDLIYNGYYDTGNNTIVNTYVNYPKSQYLLAGIGLQKTFAIISSTSV